MKNIQTISICTQNSNLSVFRWLDTLRNAIHNDMDYITEPNQKLYWTGQNIT